MKLLSTDNKSDVKEMIQAGFSYAIRNYRDEEMVVVSRHRTYASAKKAAEPCQAIVPLDELFQAW